MYFRSSHQTFVGKFGTASEISVLHPIEVINNKPWTYLHYNDIRNILNEELPWCTIYTLFLVLLLAENRREL